MKLMLIKNSYHRSGIKPKHCSVFYTYQTQTKLCMLSVYITGTYLILKKIYFLTWKLSWERETDRQTDKERATCVHARNINLFVKVVLLFFIFKTSVFNGFTLPCLQDFFNIILSYMFSF